MNDQPDPATARLRKVRNRWRTFGYGVLALALLVAGYFSFRPGVRPSQPPPQTAAPEPLPPPDRIVTGTISRGQNLSSAMRASGIPPELAEKIGRHLKPLVNLRKVKPGDCFELRLDPSGQFLNFTYQSGPLEICSLTPTPSGDWLPSRKEILVDKYWVRVAGEVSSSLFEAMDRVGEKDTLIMDFADIFAGEIDFHSDLQPGDRFDLVVEKYYVENTFVKYGRILYAGFHREKRTHEALYYSPPGTRGDYYTPRGESLRKAFLRSPLKFTRISSGYSKSRYHPILGGTRPHLGIDYAAPQGSPVWAVADGTVVSRGWNGGYGNQVVIRHPRGYQSMYGHLSGFAPGISNGRAVHQKQIIGYVGSTGLSTGPHLDFRLLKGGAYRNPLKEISPRAAPLGPEHAAKFQEACKPVLQRVSDPSAPQREKVASLTSKDLETPAVAGPKASGGSKSRSRHQVSHERN